MVRYDASYYSPRTDIENLLDTPELALGNFISGLMAGSSKESVFLTCDVVIERKGLSIWKQLLNQSIESFLLFID